MPASIRLPALAALAALTLSGCATWNDRYNSAYDPVMTFLGARPQGTANWPAAQLPDLPALATYGDFLPDRQPAPAPAGYGWPPLAPVADPSDAALPPTVAGASQPSPSRAPTSDPARAADGGEPLVPR